jgi:hypothetical protein
LELRDAHRQEETNGPQVANHSEEFILDASKEQFGLAEILFSEDKLEFSEAFEEI